MHTGYLNLKDGGTQASPGKEEMVTPKCWKTVYYLLDLYATMPETKTIAHRSLINNLKFFSQLATF